ncbi:MAG: NAD(P)H-hydrate dehydratase [Clostridia bacterium]|nr:NAD(P)H-hydrate dehydratase [Clostridia bacterium]
MNIIERVNIRRLEEAVAKDLGISMLDLMERAGAAVAECASAMAQKYACKRIIVLCGKGGNGGDGLVAARYLRQDGYSVVVHLVGGEPVGDAATMLERYDGRIAPYSEPGDGDLVIDAIFGAGFVGRVPASIAAIIQSVNRSGAKVLSVDLASGQNGDECYPRGAVMRAHHIVTFFLPKPAHLALPENMLSVVSLGASEGVLSAYSKPFMQPNDLRIHFPKRPWDRHKGNFGHILIVGGACGMSGAVCMSALSALRSGCGLVSVCVPKDNMAVVATKLPAEVMTVTDLKKADFSAYSAVVCGPGLGNHLPLLQIVLKNAQCPILLDADALNLLAKTPKLWTLIQQPLVLTPHPGEMSRLAGKGVEQVQTARVQTALDFAQQHPSVVVLKGAHTVIADESGNLTHCPVGNPGMATAGAGDVLSGIIGAFLARGLAPWDAAMAGTFVHGLAGDFAAVSHGEDALIASDIIANIGKAISDLKGDIR